MISHRQATSPMVEDPTIRRGKWYDLTDLTEFHNDLRISWQDTLHSVTKRPLLRKHMTDCAECATIRSAYENEVAPVKPAERRRMKVIISPTEMAKILGLPSAQSIIHMYAVPDPNTVVILVESPELDPVSETAETPAVKVSTVTDQAA